MKDSRSWSHMSTKITDGNYLKTFGSLSRKLDEKEKNKKNIMAIAKLFALNPDAKIKFTKNLTCVRDRKKRSVSNRKSYLKPPKKIIDLVWLVRVKFYSNVHCGNSY